MLVHSPHALCSHFHLMCDGGMKPLVRPSFFLPSASRVESMNASLLSNSVRSAVKAANAVCIRAVLIKSRDVSMACTRAVMPGTSVAGPIVPLASSLIRADPGGCCCLSSAEPRALSRALAFPLALAGPFSPFASMTQKNDQAFTLRPESSKLQISDTFNEVLKLSHSKSDSGPGWRRR